MRADAVIQEALRLYTSAAWSSLERLSTGVLGSGEGHPGEALPDPQLALLRAIGTCPLKPCQADDLEALYRHSPEAACWIAIARSHVSIALHRMLSRHDAGAEREMRAAIQALLAAAASLDCACSDLEQERLLASSASLVQALSSQQDLRIAIQAATLPRHLIFILGMHRSGTSALSGMLVKAGFEAPRDPMPATEANPLGYWESLALMQINDRLLERLHSHWDSVEPLADGWMTSEPARIWRSELISAMGRVFADSHHPIIKDPRFCILMPGLQPWLQSALLRISFLIPVRHPLEVASSLQKSERTPILQGLQLWLSHTLMAEHSTRPYSRLLVDFQQLIHQPAAILERCLAELNDPADPAEFGSAADQAAAFIDPQLQRQRLQTAAGGAAGGGGAASSRGIAPRSEVSDTIWYELAERVYAVLREASLSPSERIARLEPLRRQWLNLAS